MESRQQSPAGSEPANSHSQEFLTSGRTGRRNALPDILSEHAVVTSSDLPARFQKLSTQDGAGPSTSDAPGPSKDPKQTNNGS